MPKLAVKLVEEEANALTSASEAPSTPQTERGELTQDDLAEAASFHDVVGQSVQARGSRPGSGIVLSKKHAQPIQVPSMDARSNGLRAFFVYAVLAGVIVGLLAWCAVRYL